MNKIMLKTIRLLAPGVITLVCLLPYPIKLGNLEVVFEVLPGNVLPVLVTPFAVIIGAVYYGLNVRAILWRGFVKKCHQNVWARMIKPHYSHPAVKGVIDHLTDKNVMRVFYHVVDNDRSLSDQAHDVRMNGAILTTIIDAILLLIFFAATYMVTFFLIGLTVFKWLTAVLILLQGPLWLLKGRVSKKHMQLENEQLEVIEQLHSNTVLAKLQEIK